MDPYPWGKNVQIKNRKNARKLVITAILFNFLKVNFQNISIVYYFWAFFFFFNYRKIFIRLFFQILLIWIRICILKAARSGSAKKWNADPQSCVHFLYAFISRKNAAPPLSGDRSGVGFLNFSYLNVRYSGSRTPLMMVFSSGSPEPIACGETRWVKPALDKRFFCVLLLFFRLRV